MHPSSAGRLEKDVHIGLEIGLLGVGWNQRDILVCKG